MGENYQTCENFAWSDTDNRLLDPKIKYHDPNLIDPGAADRAASRNSASASRRQGSVFRSYVLPAGRFPASTG
jgi:hypothetical protein